MNDLPIQIIEIKRAEVDLIQFEILTQICHQEIRFENHLYYLQVTLTIHVHSTFNIIHQTSAHKQDTPVTQKER